jgi:flagellar basal-body rod protein FlgC
MLEAISARDIAVSGLKAQRARMTVIANNIANAYTTRTNDGGPFRRQLSVFRGDEIKPAMDPTKLGVDFVRAVPDPSPFRPTYMPGHPDADDEGYVLFPNIDLAMEMVDLVSAQRAYDANVSVVVAGKRMNQKAVEILQA